jgi:metal-responsive CopG/Arc/MetJ family transcriptional regulator
LNDEQSKIILVGFKDKADIIQKIDKMAEEAGLNRSNFLRQVIREKIKSGM